MTDSLIGTKIRFSIGEPWDFRDFNPTNSFIGEITSAIPSERDWITVKWQFLWEGKTYLFGCMQNRYKGDNLIEWLLRGRDIHCNMTFFETDCEFGPRLAQLTRDELDKLHTNKPIYDAALGLIGAVQLASVNPPAWER